MDESTQCALKLSAQGTNLIMPTHTQVSHHLLSYALVTFSCIFFNSVSLIKNKDSLS